jgi:iron complex transport system ATP-binding protein
MKIVLKEASFAYDSIQGNIFDGINLSVNDSDSLCILGPNGCGKTTLLKCIGNLLTLNHGSILIDERNIRGIPQNEIARKMGYVPQMHMPTFTFSVMEMVLMGRSPYIGNFSAPNDEDIDYAEESLRKVGMLHLRDKPYTMISGGERQLVMFARVLCQKPSMLLLDEPTSHLDFGNSIKFLDILEQISDQGMPIIMTSHFPDHAFLISQKVAIMNNGNIIAFGKTEDVITKESLQDIYGIEVQVVYLDGPVQRKICVPIKNSKSKHIKNYI